MKLTTPSTHKFCEFCGAELKTKTVELFGGNTVEQPIPCSCEESVKAIQEKIRLEECRKQAEEIRKKNAKLSKAGIRVRYWGAYQGAEDTQRLYESTLEDGLYLWGNHGRGKTHIACEIGKHGLSEGIKVLFINAPSLVRDIRASYSRTSEINPSEFVDKCVSAQLLIVDDLGQENVTKDSIEILYEIINERDLDMKSTVITSNFRRDKLLVHYVKSLGGDEGAINKAKSIVSRLGSFVSHEVEGKDHRLGR